MKKINTSIKNILRKRTPQTIHLALLWCKANERWISHVYDNFINIYIDKKERLAQLDKIFNRREFSFKDNILWDNLDENETEYWKKVEGWVSWFRINMLNIEEYIYDKDKTYYQNYTCVFNYLNNTTVLTKEIKEKLAKFICKKLLK